MAYIQWHHIYIVCVCVYGRMMFRKGIIIPQCNMGLYSLLLKEAIKMLLLSHPVVFDSLCDPMDCSIPVSSIHEISQKRILEWVAISFCRGSS